MQETEGLKSKSAQALLRGGGSINGDDGKKYLGGLDAGDQYGGFNITPEDEESIVGRRSQMSTYQSLENNVRQFESQIKQLGLENKSGAALVFYHVMDKLGIYPKENLLRRDLRKLSQVQCELECAIEQYEAETDNANEGMRSCDTQRHKAEILIERYNGMIDGLNKQLDEVKTQGKDLKARLRRGDTSPGLKEKYIGLKMEKRYINEDVRELLRKRDRAATAIVTGKGKSLVHIQNYMMRDQLLEELEGQYNKLEVIKAQLEDLLEKGKNKSLLEVVALLKGSEQALSIASPMLQKFRKYVSNFLKLITRSKKQRISQLLPDAGTLAALEESSKTGKSVIYMEAEKIMDEDDEF